MKIGMSPKVLLLLNCNISSFLQVTYILLAYLHEEWNAFNESNARPHSRDSLHLRSVKAGKNIGLLIRTTSHLRTGFFNK